MHIERIIIVRYTNQLLLFSCMLLCKYEKKKKKNIPFVPITILFLLLGQLADDSKVLPFCHNHERLI